MTWLSLKRQSKKERKSSIEKICQIFAIRFGTQIQFILIYTMTIQKDVRAKYHISNSVEISQLSDHQEVIKRRIRQYNKLIGCGKPIEQKFQTKVLLLLKNKQALIRLKNHAVTDGRRFSLQKLKQYISYISRIT